jgi:hypothetical protein
MTSDGLGSRLHLDDLMTGSSVIRQSKAILG